MEIGRCRFPIRLKLWESRYIIFDLAAKTPPAGPVSSREYRWRFGKFIALANGQATPAAWSVRFGRRNRHPAYQLDLIWANWCKRGRLAEWL